MAKGRKPMPQDMTRIVLYRQGLKFYGIDGGRDPFGGNLMPEIVEDITDTANIIAGIEYAAEENAIFIGIGPAGSGKTNALDVALSNIRGWRNNTTVVRITQLACGKFSDMSIAAGIGEALVGAEFRVPSNIRIREREIIEALGRNVANHGRLLLVIDEAQSLPPSVLKYLKILWNQGWAHVRPPMLGIVLLGQMGLRQKLSAVPELQARSEIYNCRGLRPDEIECLLRHRARNFEALTGEAIMEISAKVPNVYPLALLNYMRDVIANGFIRGDMEITPETIKSTPSAILWSSLMEAHGITLQDVVREVTAHGGHMGMVAIYNAIIGETHDGNAPAKEHVDRVHLALDALLESGGGSAKIPRQIGEKEYRRATIKEGQS